MEGLDKEVEAQVRREASSDDNIDIDSVSELSQLYSSDFKGIELQAVVIRKQWCGVRWQFRGRDSTPVRGVPYEPIALLRVYRAKIKSNSSQSCSIGYAPKVLLYLYVYIYIQLVVIDQVIITIKYIKQRPFYSN